eukprot:1662596-Prymnesium_polylepis.2
MLPLALVAARIPCSKGAEACSTAGWGQEGNARKRWTCRSQKCRSCPRKKVRAPTLRKERPYSSSTYRTPTCAHEKKLFRIVSTRAVASCVSLGIVRAKPG